MSEFSSLNKSNSDLSRESNIEMNKKEDNTKDELVKTDVEHIKNVFSNDEANSDDNIQSDVKRVENFEIDAAADDDKKIDAGDMAQTDGTDDQKTMDAENREQSKIIGSLTKHSSMQETVDKHHEQPGSHYEPERDYVYVILDVSNEKVAEEIMNDVKKQIAFKKINWKTAVKEINDRNNVFCLIVFQSAPSGSTRSEDRLNACRKQHPKVTKIIIVCVCKDNDKNHYKDCSEQLVFSKEDDNVFKYHIMADGRAHVCSRDIIKKIKDCVYEIVMIPAECIEAIRWSVE